MSDTFRRFARPPQPLTLEAVRNIERSNIKTLNDNSVYLSNPVTGALFDRRSPQAYEQKVYGLGLAPNIPKHFWQLIKGDSGAGSSIYRVAELFQELAPLGERTAATPYSKAIELATLRSTDGRPRYFHTSLFSVGQVFISNAATVPRSLNEATRFAAGIPSGTPSITGNTQLGIPQFGTTQFRIMVHDESGQRFVDVDVLGTRSMNLYGFGVTVFALIKEDGYEIDRRRVDNPPLGPGILDQSVVGARIIPIKRNDTKNINNRTVSIISPAGRENVTVLPIPPGARTVQGYTNAAGADAVLVFFATIDPLDPTAGAVVGTQGVINFPPAPLTHTDKYNVPNANSIVLINIADEPLRGWIFVFEVTP